MIFLLLLLVIVVGLCIYYLNGKYNERYWTNRGVKFYTKNKVFGPLWEFLRTDRALFEIFSDIYKSYPNEPAVGVGSFMTPALYVKDPQNIHHVLQSDFQAFSHRGIQTYEQDLLADNILFMHGNRWKVMRQSMTPLFTTAKLKEMFYILDKSAKDFIEYLKKDPTKLKGDVFSTISTFCSAAIGATVFGIRPESIFDSPFLKMAVAALTPTTSRNLKFALANFKLNGLQLFRLSLFKDYQKFFIGAVKQVIRQREKEGVKKHDFADICVSLQKNGTLMDSETGFKLEPSDELLAAQAFFFFVAGVEPTATSIYTALVELGRNPEVLRKVHEEIDTIWEKYNGVLSYDAVCEMEYVEKVLSEALRMYPPIGFLTRFSVKDSVLPVGNIKISKGTKIFTSIFELHHDPKYYPEPEVFDPERFAQDNKNNDITYQPFGKGGRMCIGMRYARMQAKTGLVHVLKEFSPKTTVLEGGIKYSKQQVQVRPVNLDIELISRKTKTS